MSNFEDRIFKRNIPGRWSELDGGKPKSSGPGGAATPSDIRDRNNEADEYDYVPVKEKGSDALALAFDGANNNDNVDLPETLNLQIAGMNRNRPQLGPKGVLADYRAHKELEALERQVNAIHRHDVLMRMAVGAKRVDEAQDDSSTSDNKPRNADDDDNDDDDDDDDAFMREYRNARLKEMRAQAALPVFRGCKVVNTSNFTDEVDSEDPRAFVLVHLHDPAIPVSSKCQGYFEELSMKRNKWKFLEMKISDANIKIDKVALPLITIYRKGEIVEILAGITYDYLTDTFTADDLDGLLDNTIAVSS